MADREEPTANVSRVGHVYLVNPLRLWKQIFSVVILLLGLLLLMGIANWSGLVPQNAQLGDPDSTIISTKARLATTSTQKRIAFVGDSSCLVNIHIPTMKANGIDAVNLGTLSYLGIDSFGLLAQRFCKDKSDAQIFLVLHPECLRMVESSDRHRVILAQALGQKVDGSSEVHWGDFRKITVDDFKSRLLDGWLPTPMKGRLGYRYGFTHNLRNEILSTHGFMEETAQYDVSDSHGSSEYRIARRIQDECIRFRSSLPKGVRVRLLVSPIPQSHASKGHGMRVAEMQREVEKWIQADGASIKMPDVMSDSSFGTVTHLLPKAAVEYTRQLCSVLSQ